MAPRKKSETIMAEPVTAKKTTRKPAKKMGNVFGGNLNIRKEPDVTSERVGLLMNGERIEILEDLGEWLRIAEGYVMAKWVMR